MSFQSLTPEVLAQLTAALPGSVLSGDQLTEDYAHDEMISAGFRMPDAPAKFCTRTTSPSSPAGPEPGSAAAARLSAAVLSLI